MQTTIGPRLARPHESWALTRSHAAAVFARRPVALRWLCVPFSVALSAQMAAWIGRGEVYVGTGGAAAVVTPRAGLRRRRLRPGAVLPAAAVVAAVYAAVVAEAAVFGTAYAFAAFLVAWALLFAALLVARGMPARGARRDEREAIRDLGRQSPVVLLHDLARPPRVARGLGTALLADLIRSPEFAGAAIVATAAAPTLADRYEGAGMTRFSPGSLTVYYRA